MLVGFKSNCKHQPCYYMTITWLMPSTLYLGSQVQNWLVPPWVCLSERCIHYSCFCWPRSITEHEKSLAPTETRIEKVTFHKWMSKPKHRRQNRKWIISIHFHMYFVTLLVCIKYKNNYTSNIHLFIYFSNTTHGFSLIINTWSLSLSKTNHKHYPFTTTKRSCIIIISM